MASRRPRREGDFGDWLGNCLGLRNQLETVRNYVRTLKTIWKLVKQFEKRSRSPEELGDRLEPWQPQEKTTWDTNWGPIGPVAICCGSLRLADGR